MTKKILLLIGLFMLVINLKSQSFHHFMGYINKKYPITLNLIFSENQIYGTMYYNKVGNYIDINGTINGNSISMTGTLADGKITDKFTATIKNNTISGTWTNPRTGKTLPFEVKETTYDCVYEDNIKISIKDSSKRHDDYVHFNLKFDLDFPKATPFKGYEKEILKHIWIYNPSKFTFKEFIKKYTDSLYNDWKEALYTAEPEDDNFMYNYEYQYNMHSIYNYDCFYSTEIDIYLYTGGAHGLEYSAIYNFDLLKEKELTYKDIFSVDSSTFLNEVILPILEIKALENCGDSLNNELISDDLFPKTWGLTPEGIDIIYNPYDILPYACGSIEIMIPYKKISKYLQPKFKKRIGCCQ